MKNIQITWPMAIVLVAFLALLGVLAYLDHGTAATIAGALGLLVHAFTPPVLKPAEKPEAP